MVQVYLQRMPVLAGKTFGELVFHLPQATAYGLVQFKSRRCLLNPPAETVIDKLDEIVMIRSTDLSKAEMQPLAEPAHVDMGASASSASVRPALLALLGMCDFVVHRHQVYVLAQFLFCCMSLSTSRVTDSQHRARMCAAHAHVQAFARGMTMACYAGDWHPSMYRS